jgi:hypothetical protein
MNPTDRHPPGRDKSDAGDDFIGAVLPILLNFVAILIIWAIVVTVLIAIG